MSVPWIWKLSLSDGQKTLEFEGVVTWLYGGDYDVVFQVAGYVDAKQGEVLDAWESQKTQLDIDMELAQCRIGDIPVECDDQTKDYYSQQGKGTIEWEVGNEVRIKITFQEGGETQ